MGSNHGRGIWLSSEQMGSLPSCHCILALGCLTSLPPCVASQRRPWEGGHTPRPTALHRSQSCCSHTASHLVPALCAHCWPLLGVRNSLSSHAATGPSPFSSHSTCFFPSAFLPPTLHPLRKNQKWAHLLVGHTALSGRRENVDICVTDDCA